MTKINAEQAANLHLASKYAKEYREIKAMAEAQVREEVKVRISDALTRLKDSVHTAHSSGVPANQIKIAIGTKDHRTFQNLLEGFTPVTYVPRKQFEIDREDRTITFFYADWENERIEGTVVAQYKPEDSPNILWWDDKLLSGADRALSDIAFDVSKFAVYDQWCAIAKTEFKG